MVLENDDKGEVLATLVMVWEGRGRVDCVCVCGKGNRGAECLVHGCLSATLMCGLRGEDRGSGMCGRGKWGEVRKCPVNVEMDRWDGSFCSCVPDGSGQCREIGWGVERDGRRRLSQIEISAK